MVCFEFKFDLDSTDYAAPLGFRLLLNSKEIYSLSHVSESRIIKTEIADTEEATDQELIFELYGKSQDFTKLDENGKIVGDALLTIKNITIDDIKVDYPVHINTVYNHDYNGTKAPVQEKFYGVMGCNGRAVFKFSTPIFLWLLDNS